MKKRLLPALTLTLTMVWLAAPLPAFANEFEAPLKEQAQLIKSWISDDPIVTAIKDQNTRFTGLSQADIDAKDNQWRAETANTEQPLINEVLGNTLSTYLKQKLETSNGLYTEIFVMDNHGLNVGQSGITSDYWQGDEDKWQKTFLMGADAIHLSDVEQDESTQIYQSQVSLPVVDPASGSVIGAITVGINVEAL